MFVSVAGAVLNIALNYVFIQKYGFIAAGYTTVFCYILFAVGHYLLHKLILKQNNIRENVFDSKRILIYSAAVLIFMLLTVLLYRFSIARYIIIAVIAIAVLIKHKMVIAIVRRALNK